MMCAQENLMRKIIPRSEYGKVNKSGLTGLTLIAVNLTLWHSLFRFVALIKVKRV